VVIYFHGTPGSRLDLGFGEHMAGEQGVRLVTFDRPGYGRSTAAPFGLASIAADAHAVADGLGVARFATLGMSGGGPGARLVIREGEGHFGIMEHLGEMLDALTGPEPAS
jgi:pimeloyl-ACP methyl ester carboxylesterase